MAETKHCPQCKSVKPHAGFPARKSNKDGLYTYCRPCSTSRAKAYYLANHEIAKAKGRENWINMSPVSRQKHRDVCNRRQERIRERIWNHYGRACACCGEADTVFLTLDHTHGGGAQERRETGRSGVGFYALLIRRGFPDGYQTLCFNCNCAKGRFGVCPHQTHVRLLIESVRVTNG